MTTPQLPLANTLAGRSLVAHEIMNNVELNEERIELEKCLRHDN
jgi:hypothetical protein